jgi:two-component system response regulator
MGAKLVFLVEDNPDDEELTRLALQQCSVPNKVIVARDGAEALEFLSGVGNLPDDNDFSLPELILLDLKLPKVSGLEVLKSIRVNPRTHLIPVVVLTSSSERDDILSSYLFGANSYIRKPVNFKEFREKMELLGSYWLVLNQRPPLPQ